MHYVWVILEGLREHNHSNEDSQHTNLYSTQFAYWNYVKHNAAGNHDGVVEDSRNMTC